jgi:uncharacterized protein with HEPN domain
MKDRDLRDYINDLIEACEEILSFTQGMSYSDFAGDKKTVNAVIRSLEVIGEATKKLPASFRNNFPNIPWKQMAGMRDKLIHEYFGIDMQMVWQAVERHIPYILPLIKEITID